MVAVTTDGGTCMGGHGHHGGHGTHSVGHNTQIGGHGDHIGGHSRQSHNGIHSNGHYVQFQDDADTGGRSHTDVSGQSLTMDGGGHIHIGGQTIGGRSQTNAGGRSLGGHPDTDDGGGGAHGTITMGTDDNMDGKSGWYDQIPGFRRRRRRRRDHLGPVMEPRLTEEDLVTF